MLKRASLALPVLLPVMLLAGCGGSGNGTASDDGGAAPTATTSGTGTGTCDYETDPVGSAGKKVDLPPATPDVSGTVKATIHTSVGDLGLTLDATAAPCTVNSFVSLAKQGFYDHTTCHRLGAVPGFQMLQCGDPLGNGTGGPGYTIPDELTGTETYPAGTLAMARTSAPHSGGSQFFMVFGDTELSPDYTVFGHLDPAAVTALAKVAAAGTDDSEGQGVGKPNTPVTFTSVSVG